MKKILFFIVLVVIVVSMSYTTTSCSDKKPVSDSVLVDTTSVDTTAQDSTEEIIAQTPVPKAADELFDDFFFNFCANKKLQLKRIKFPLPVVSGNKTTMLQKKQWKVDHFFMRQEFYTLILDNSKQLEWAKDTSIQHVVVEKIFLDKSLVKQYVFDKIDGLWTMTSIETKGFGNSKNASFLAFYKKFVSNQDFQQESINEPLTFVGPDPDDDFKNITGSLEPEQWPAFAPELPQGMIYNILYGQKYTESSQKIFMIRGIANGQEASLTFKRKGGNWKLIKLTT